ncbi:hypothetical protein [Nocardia sp. NPDC004722]
MIAALTTGGAALILLVLGVILKEEVSGWANALPRFLLQSAAKRVGPEYRDRLEEEWLAELEYIPGGPVTKTVWASYTWLGRKKTARTLAEIAQERGVQVETTTTIEASPSADATVHKPLHPDVVASTKTMSVGVDVTRLYREDLVIIDGRNTLIAQMKAPLKSDIPPGG